VDKTQIISEIQRTAADNDGVPLGQRLFERETGISQSSWREIHWRNWGDAVKEAGFVANRQNEAHDRSFLILNLTQLTQKNKCFPTYADMRLERTSNKSFPGHQPLTRLGTVSERIELVRQCAKDNPEYKDVLGILPQAQVFSDEDAPDASDNTKEGYVYMGLLTIGREKHYKIGKADLVGRRTDQISIQLPEDLELVHAIRTDDAFGIEDYWHRRFKEKNTKGEWFTLSREDIQIFKKRKFM